MKIGKQVAIGIGALVVVAALMASTIFAHPGFGPGRFGMMRRMGPSLLEQLQLSTDQRAQIESIVASGRETVRPLLQQLREKHLALRDAARSQPFDETVVRSQAQQVADTQAELMVARTQLRNQVLALLTDEQKSRLGELRAERLEQFRNWRRQNQGATGPT
jgi:Spy/CpxP family protein refolding chaperone